LLFRFAYFFINPLFTKSSTEREIEAVNSEHEQNVPDDEWRSADIQKHTSSPNHPYQRFATGNLDSLWNVPKEKKIDVIAALMEYHSKFYSSNIMTLAVLGSESLDDLESMVGTQVHLDRTKLEC
jgi:insulysin